jgi:hypothetical protein
VAGYVTLSERRFAEYLDNRDLTYEYELPKPEGESGGNPDFLVHTPAGDVACEVTELSWFPALAEATSTTSRSHRLSILTSSSAGNSNRSTSKGGT